MKNIIKLSVLAIMLNSNLVNAGCCPTETGICCGGPCQYQCSGQNELDGLLKINTEEKQRMTENKNNLESKD